MDATGHVMHGVALLGYVRANDTRHDSKKEQRNDSKDKQKSIRCFTWASCSTCSRNYISAIIQPFGFRFGSSNCHKGNRTEPPSLDSHGESDLLHCSHTILHWYLGNYHKIRHQLLHLSPLTWTFHVCFILRMDMEWQQSTNIAQ